MAYQRPNALSAQYNSNNSSFIMNNGSVVDGSTINTVTNFSHSDGKDKNRESYHSSTKPLVIFSIDLSHLSHSVQFVILIMGLIIFMCLYGYYQELVIYHWFNRKLSMFSTFLHFLFCSLFAQLQRQYSNNNSNSINNSSCLSPCSSNNGGFLSMGNATPRIALFYYIMLVLMKTIAQGMSNLSMTEINYPAKVLFKSANPIVTIIIGRFYLNKKYQMRDYFVVVLLVIGLYIFITDESAARGADSQPRSTLIGIIYVTISMLGSAGVPMIQEHCILTYNASVEDLIYYCFLGSALISLIMSIILGEFFTGMRFLLQSGSSSTWFAFMAFCSFGFLGAHFSTSITQQHGALVNGISNTVRKAVTIAISFAMFPERNQLTRHKLAGIAVFFSGLLIKIFSKHEQSAHSVGHTALTSKSSATTAAKLFDEEEQLALSISSNSPKKATLSSSSGGGSRNSLSKFFNASNSALDKSLTDDARPRNDSDLEAAAEYDLRVDPDDSSDKYVITHHFHEAFQQHQLHQKQLSPSKHHSSNNMDYSAVMRM